MKTLIRNMPKATRWSLCIQRQLEQARTTTYEPGVLAIDRVCFPQIADKTTKRSHFIAFDLATHWAFVSGSQEQQMPESIDFLHRLDAAAPMRIRAILTDYGREFTNECARFTSNPNKQQTFEQFLFSKGIEHRRFVPVRGRANSLVERFINQLSDIARQAQSISLADMSSQLMQYVSEHNHSIPQSALNQKTPIQELETWRALRPEMFDRRVNQGDVR